MKNNAMAWYLKKDVTTTNHNSIDYILFFLPISSILLLLTRLKEE